ncbi:hypothetical protein GCK72_002411 [Caenorhabditis remanei]|uniref:Methyltransferase domain-containing protein n=1 Tax=Caenorhabditis remanei TaxID=31234 RepID=A0A6A5HXA9_CAERE|nr:hypothetical protein GCK72_002411 [Caenorhabditis remanei]KAF1770592.1 hypothetical protein GCK72_002411 [Caenorhabditis remanei]
MSMSLLVFQPEELISFANSTHKELECRFPDSLKELKSNLKRLEYSRKFVQSPDKLWEKWTGRKPAASLQTEFRTITSNELLRKKIKLKKQHEIDRIIELISQIQTFMDHESGSQNTIDSVIDFGAGVGHLSRMISLVNKLAVMAVEGNHQFTLSAHNLDEKLLQDSNINLTTTPMRFTSFVTEEMATKVDDFAQNSAIIVGLHCCGDFSSTILKVFLKSRKARALVLFGCCYHKEFQCFHFLNPDNKDAQTLNDTKLQTSTVFPLSRKWKGCDLSYNHREIACHNNENMASRFGKTSADSSRYARAHLEKWIWEVSDSPSDRNIGMCSVKCVDNKTTFEEYIRKALAKRGNHLLEKVLRIIPKSELSSFVSSFKSSQFDSFDVLRLMFAPAIESAIIDDRISFLQENGVNAQCIPLFDPTISPRNLAIIAYKHC